MVKYMPSLHTVLLVISIYGAIFYLPTDAKQRRASLDYTLVRNNIFGIPLNRVNREIKMNDCPCEMDRSAERFGSLAQTAQSTQTSTPRPRRHKTDKTDKLIKRMKYKLPSSNSTQSDAATVLIEEDKLPRLICPIGQWACPMVKNSDRTWTKCIPNTRVCDSHIDCDLGEDEDPIGCAFHRLAKDTYELNIEENIQKEGKSQKSKEKRRKRSRQKEEELRLELETVKQKLRGLDSAIQCITDELDDVLKRKQIISGSCSSLFSKCNCELH